MANVTLTGVLSGGAKTPGSSDVAVISAAGVTVPNASYFNPDQVAAYTLFIGDKTDTDQYGTLYIKAPLNGVDGGVRVYPRDEAGSPVTYAHLGYYDTGNRTYLGNAAVKDALQIDTSGHVYVKTGGDVLSTAAGGSDLGSASVEWGDVFIANTKSVYLGNGQEAQVQFNTDELNVYSSDYLNIWAATGDPSTAANIYIGTNASGSYSRSIFLQPGDITGWEFDRSGQLIARTGTTRIAPSVSGALDLGSTASPLGAVYLADDKYIWFGATQDASIGWSNSNNRFEILSDGNLILEASGGQIQFWVADLIVDSGQDILPSAVGGCDLGNPSAEWGSIYVASDSYLYFGNDQRFSIRYYAAGDRAILYTGGSTGTDVTISAGGNSGGAGGNLSLRPGTGSTVGGQVQFSNVTGTSFWYIDGDTPTLYPSTTLDIGKTTNPVGNVYVADDRYAWFGNNLDGSIGYDESTDDKLEITCSNGILMTGNLNLASGYDILPTAGGGCDLGSGSAQWGNIYLDNSKFVYFGDSAHYAGFVSGFGLYFRTASAGYGGTSEDVLIQTGGAGSTGITGDLWLETGGGSGATYGSIKMRPGYTTGGGIMLELGSGTIGFYGATPVTKPTVSGSKGGNAALASLMTALANLGLVTDSTT